MNILVILLTIILNATVISAQGKSASVQNVEPHYVNGIPDQIALEQTQQQQQQFVVDPNAQQNFIIDGNFLHPHQQLQTVPGISGQTISPLVYSQNQQPAAQIYQQQPSSTQMQIQTPQENQFANFQYPQGTQILQNSHQAPVYQQQGLQYFPVSPYTAQGHFSPFLAPIPHHYGALNFPVENPSFVSVGHAGHLASPVFHLKPTVIQQHVPVPVPVSPVVAVKQIVKVPVAVKFQPICTVYPFQKNIPGCVLEKALFPGKYHPDVVIPLPSKKTDSGELKTTATTTTATRPVTTSTAKRPEAKVGRVGPAKTEFTKKKNTKGFVELNNAGGNEENTKDTTTSKELNFDEEDEQLFLELEREMQNKKDQEN